MISRDSSDATLWDAIKNDDEKAFSFLFDRYWERVFTTVFSVTEDRDVCSDIVHDIFLNIWSKRGQLTITYFNAYLTTSARYQVYRHMQKFRKIPVTYTEDYTGISEHLTVDKADDDIRYLEFEQQMEVNLQALPKRCKEIFALSRQENLSNDEIAQRLDISKRTVENQLTVALRHLRVTLKPFLSIVAVLEVWDRF